MRPVSPWRFPSAPGRRSQARRVAPLAHVQSIYEMLEDLLAAVAVEYALPDKFRAPLGAELRALLLTSVGAAGSGAPTLPLGPLVAVMSRFARRFLVGEAGVVKPADPLALYIFDPRVMRWPGASTSGGGGGFDAEAAGSCEVARSLRVEHMFDALKVG